MNICKICEKSFEHHRSLKRHMKIHNGIEWTCPECPALTFSWEDNFKRHIKNVHPSASTSSLQCNICLKTLQHKRNLNRHMKIHNGILFNATCGTNRINITETLKRHREVHNAIVWSCPDCLTLTFFSFSLC